MPKRIGKSSKWIFLFVMVFLSISCGLMGQAAPEQESIIDPIDVDSMDENGTESEEAEHQEESESGEVDTVTGEDGLSRVNPVPLGTLISVPDWDIQVLEFLRGEAAAAVVNGGDRKIDPPPAGYEYALAKVFLRCTSLDGNSHSIGISEMYISGSSHIKFGDKLDGWPAPEFLYEDMIIAEAVEGWIDTLIPVAEEDLMLIYDLDLYEEPRITRYFELEEGASITPSGTQFEQTPNEVGVSQEQPAAFNQLMIMPGWDITVVSSMRGEEALSSLRQDSPNYSGPEEGDEYVLVEVVIHYFGSDDFPAVVYDGNFYTEVDGNTYRGRIRYPMQSSFDWINSTIFPGASIEGWAIVSLPEGIANPVIAFYPGIQTGDKNVRYFTIP